MDSLDISLKTTWISPSTREGFVSYLGMDGKACVCKVTSQRASTKSEQKLLLAACPSKEGLGSNLINGLKFSKFEMQRRPIHRT